MTRIAVLGGGRIGEALLGGLLAAGRDAGDLVVAERYPARAQELTASLGVTAAPVDEAVRGAGTVVVAVKPQDVVALLGEVAGALEPGALVVSLCAGLPTSLFEGALPDGTPVVRVMPNTPMLLGAAMCAISPGAHATPAHLDETEALLSTVGAVLRALDKLNGTVTDIEVGDRQSQAVGRIEVTLDDCRYPEGDPAGDAYAFLTVREVGVADPVFRGWMIASAPALNPMDHPRYDVWVLRCMTS